MTRTFNAKLVAVAATASIAMGQLPRECFFVTDSHGQSIDEYEMKDFLFESDLAFLMTYFKPDMRLQSIKPHTSEEGGIGFQMRLGIDENTAINLGKFGAEISADDETISRPFPVS